jgi:hypothetical protein
MHNKSIYGLKPTSANVETIDITKIIEVELTEDEEKGAFNTGYTCTPKRPTNYR